MLRWAHEQEWLARVPKAPRLPKQDRNPRDLDAETVAKVFAELPEQGRVFQFIAVTDCRPGEACALRWEHVHQDHGYCLPTDHKKGGKTGKPRMIPLVNGAQKVISKLWKKRHPCGFVFVSRFGRPYTTAGVRANLRNAARRAFGEGGEKGPSAHRCSAATSVSASAGSDRGEAGGALIAPRSRFTAGSAASRRASAWTARAEAGA